MVSLPPDDTGLPKGKTYRSEVRTKVVLSLTTYVGGEQWWWGVRSGGHAHCSVLATGLPNMQVRGQDKGHCHDYIAELLGDGHLDLVSYRSENGPCPCLVVC